MNHIYGCGTLLFVALSASCSPAGSGGHSTSPTAGRSSAAASVVVSAGQPTALGSAGSCPEGMVSIPGGTYLMGSNEGMADTKPPHQVQVQGFCMDLTEVTLARYDVCVRGGACPAASTSVKTETPVEPEELFWSNYCTAQSNTRDYPINCVDWEQATAYCKWAGKRLPTEEEWEYAARGTDGRTYPWGNQAPGPTLLNVCGSECARYEAALLIEFHGTHNGNDGWVGVAPVGSYPQGKSPFGLLDMAGNVSEWTSSKYVPYNNSSLVTDRFVIRGGSWSAGHPSHSMTFYRFDGPPWVRSSDTGFRCASASNASRPTVPASR